MRLQQLNQPKTKKTENRTFCVLSRCVVIHILCAKTKASEVSFICVYQVYQQWFDRRDRRDGEVIYLTFWCIQNKTDFIIGYKQAIAKAISADYSLDKQIDFQIKWTMSVLSKPLTVEMQVALEKEDRLNRIRNRKRIQQHRQEKGKRNNRHRN